MEDLSSFSITKNTYAGFSQLFEKFPSLLCSYMIPAELPVAHRPRVNVDKIGLRIESDTAALQLQGGFAQGLKMDAWKPQVNGLAAHVVTGLGDTGGVLAQFTIGCRRPVAGNDLERLADRKLFPQGVHDIESLGVDPVHLVSAMVPQQVVDAAQGLFEIPALLPVDDLPEFFPGMRVVQAKRTLGMFGKKPGQSRTWYCNQGSGSGSGHEELSAIENSLGLVK